MAEERIALVTGASSGIGLYTALGLARAGMHVVMAGRDPQRTEAARQLVGRRSGSDRAEVLLADFASLAEVRRLAGEVRQRYPRLDVLVNNAGLMSRHYRLSAEGYELTFAVNHLAPFLLTNLLLDRLTGSAPRDKPVGQGPTARIVTVASQAHKGARIEIDNLARPRDWSLLRAYSRSKLCNILFTRELARRLAGSEVVVTCLHPGVVATGIGERGGIVEIAWRIGKPFMMKPERGAETSIFLATVADPTPYHGEYVIDKRPAPTDPAARDEALARLLWDESARLVGL